MLKLRETISDEANLPLENDLVSKVFGKDNRGRTRSVGTKVSRTQLKASASARALLKSSQTESNGTKARLDTMEGTLNTLVGTVNSLREELKGTQHVHPSPAFVSNEIGSNTPHSASQQLRSPQSVSPQSRSPQTASPQSTSSHNTKCQLMNFDNEVVAIGVVCKDATAGKCQGRIVPATHEKVVVDIILLPAERTAKENHMFAKTFGEVGNGGYVIHPKFAIQYI